MWWVIGLAALLLGTSVLAYVVLFLDRPILAGIILGAGLLLTLGEGAFRLHDAAEKGYLDATHELAAYADQQPKLSFGRAEIPRQSQRLPLPQEVLTQRRGRIIRVPVTNAQGAGEARQVHARLTFTTGSDLDDMVVPSPTQGEWSGEGEPEIEINLPGNGRARLLDIVMVRDGSYPYAHEWTRQSRATGLMGYELQATPFDVEIEVMGSGPGPNAPVLKDTLRVRCGEQKIVADWLSAGPDESTNYVVAEGVP